MTNEREPRKRIKINDQISIGATPLQIIVQYRNHRMYFDYWWQVLREIFNIMITKKLNNGPDAIKRIEEAVDAALEEIREIGEKLSLEIPEADFIKTAADKNG